MIVTNFTRKTLAVRREARRLEALGYRRHETDWEIDRGAAAFRGEVILDAIISVDRKYVYTKIGKPIMLLPCEQIGWCIYPKCLKNCHNKNCKSLCHTKSGTREDLYGDMEPKKKRRNLFSTREYRMAETIEEAAWMAREETKLISWL